MTPQPMSTAPKDGTQVLLRCNAPSKPYYFIARWDRYGLDGWYAVNAQFPLYICEPNCWYNLSELSDLTTSELDAFRNNNPSPYDTIP